MNTVTRSGTNQFHGRAFFFDRDNAWGARNPFTQLAQLQPDGTVAAVPFAPTDNRQQWGVALGGPVRTDRIFWFFTNDQFHRNFPAISRPGNITTFFNRQLTSSDLETLRERLGVPLPSYALEQYQQFVSGLMGETGLVPRTASQIILFPKLDWQLNERNHISVQYNYLRWNSPHGALTQTAASYGISSFGDDHVTDDVLIGRWNTFLTANLMHELRVQYGRDFESEFSAPPSAFEQPFSQNAFGRSPQITLIGSGSGLRIGKPPTLDRAALQTSTARRSPAPSAMYAATTPSSSATTSTTSSTASTASTTATAVTITPACSTSRRTRSRRAVATPMATPSVLRPATATTRNSSVRRSSASTPTTMQFFSAMSGR